MARLLFNTFRSHQALFPVVVAMFVSAAFSRAAAPDVVRMVADITTSPRAGSFGNFTVINDELYFTANDGDHGIELWKTDGTNVARLTDINYGTLPSFISAPTLFNGEVYFRAGSNINGFIDSELWKLSGTNVSLVADIRPGSTGSLPAGFTVYNGVLYFSANDGTSGNEL